MREERPEQEDLHIPDDDRTLWQLQQHRAQEAQAWKTWLRESYYGRLQDVDGPVVRLPGPRVSYMPRNWPQNNQETGQEEEGGDT